MSWLDDWGLSDDTIAQIDGVTVVSAAKWRLAVRHITSATDTRTVIAAILPLAAYNGHCTLDGAFRRTKARTPTHRKDECSVVLRG